MGWKDKTKEEWEHYERSNKAYRAFWAKANKGKIKFEVAL